ncbi:hypothetical protein FB451DRAFT_791506 [Mycena latifolia]|nr:hypothetical protein FB451DRAFT_791506 [Mycena latifolia]
MSTDSQVVIPPERLPPELMALVIEELADSKPDILACSLVCRGWLPFARNNLDIFIGPKSAPTFLELIASPITTFVSTLRRLELFGYEEVPFPEALFPVLTNFVSLRSLSLYSPVPDDLPPLPWLVELSLGSTRFPSYADFVKFMSDLPCLQRLELCNVSWATGPADGNHAFPPLELRFLELYWGNRPPIEGILFALRTCELLWSFPLYPSPTELSTASAYMRHLGKHLKYLELDFGDKVMDRVATLDLSANTALEHLKIHNALRFNVIPSRNQFDVAVCPDLEPLLSRIIPYARVDTLVLKVGTDSISNPAPWNPITQLSDLLDTPPFASVRRVEFIVDGGAFCLKGSARLAREHFEPILRAAIPSHSDRQIVCSDGDDPDEIYC